MADEIILNIEKNVLEKNETLAQVNRKRFKANKTVVLNIISSPGSGKTFFLERLLTDLAGSISTGVIVGDLATDNDAKRLSGRGARTLQIETDGMCHLDAKMVTRAVDTLGIDGLDLLIIENVGNLVCPTSHDLGEDLRIVMLSVTEGEDKPLKYPATFKAADVIIVSKLDIAEAVGCDLETLLQNAHDVSPKAKVICTSAKTGEGMQDFYTLLKQVIETQNT